MRNPPRALAGHGGARSCARVDVGGSAGCGHRRARVQAAKVRYGLRELAQRDQGVGVELTEGSWWPELLHKVDVGEARVVGRGGARGEECWRSTLGLLMPQRDPCGPCEGVPGFSEAPESTVARNFCGAPSYLRWRYGENPARAGLRVTIGALESSLVPRRSSFGAWSELGCGGAAWLRRRDALLRVEAGRSG